MANTPKTVMMKMWTPPVGFFDDDELAKVQVWYHEMLADRVKVTLTTQVTTSTPRYELPPYIYLERDDITSDTFERAIEHIQTYGWCQHNVRNEREEVCAIGAFRYSHASGWGEFASGVQQYVMNLMGLHPRWHNIPEWNDEPGRTKEEVLDALMLGAKKLRDMGR